MRPEFPTREQFAGCLIGQALGDALGSPVEGASPAICRQYVEDALDGAGLPAQGFGQYTDDTQLARELMLSLVGCCRLDPEDYARRIARLFSDEQVVGAGRATEAAAFRLSAGIPWNDAGTPSPAAGNGSAMRAGPIGLLFFDAPPALIVAARDQGRSTHADRRCSAGAVAVAGGVALALRPGPLQLTGFVSTLSWWAAAIDPSVAAALARLEGLVALPPEQARAEITAAYTGEAGLEAAEQFQT
jgi:ADP-ribosylglycohydrolase